jgi:hypothetical protein
VTFPAPLGGGSSKRYTAAEAAEAAAAAEATTEAAAAAAAAHRSAVKGREDVEKGPATLTERASGDGAR